VEQLHTDFLFHHSIATLVLFFAFFSIIRIGQFILLLRYFFSQISIDIKSLHPDGCGGVRALGGFSVKLGYVLGAVGTSVILTAYLQSYLLGDKLGDYFIWSPAIILFIVLYSICAPVVFFAPVGTAHKAMQGAKERELLRISGQFDLDYRNMMKFLPGKTRSIKTELEKIEQLKRLYKIVDSFPVWPFNYQNILRFILCVLGPFLFSVLPAILGLILR
jgi:hypothetical protein